MDYDREVLVGSSVFLSFYRSIVIGRDLQLQKHQGKERRKNDKITNTKMEQKVYSKIINKLSERKKVLIDCNSLE